MRKRKLTSVLITLAASTALLASTAGASVANENSDASPSDFAPAACSVTAATPYKSDGLVKGTGASSGCSGNLRGHLKWDRLGPDHRFASNTGTANTVVPVATSCNWSGNRLVYVEALIEGTNFKDQSSRANISC